MHETLSPTDCSQLSIGMQSSSAPLVPPLRGTPGPPKPEAITLLYPERRRQNFTETGRGCQSDDRNGALDAGSWIQSITITKISGVPAKHACCLICTRVQSAPASRNEFGEIQTQVPISDNTTSMVAEAPDECDKIRWEEG